MHGFRFAWMVLVLQARFWICMHSIHKFFSFLGIYTGEFFHESILGTRHFDIRSQGAELVMDGSWQIDYCDTPR